MDHRMMISRIAWAGTAALLIATASFDASGQELEPRAYSPSPSEMNFLGFTYLRSTGGVGVDPSLPLDNVSAAINIASLGYARTFGLLGRSASVGLVLPYSRADVSGDVFEQQRTGTYAKRRKLAALRQRNQTRQGVPCAGRLCRGSRERQPGHGSRHVGRAKLAYWLQGQDGRVQCDRPARCVRGCHQAPVPVTACRYPAGATTAAGSNPRCR